MDLLVYTNAYPPQQCPSAEAVDGFAAELRRLGHGCVVLAPALRGYPRREAGVVRVPLERVAGGAETPIDRELPRGFRPELVHVFDPFLMGILGLRYAYARNLPLVFSPTLLYPGLLQGLTGSPAHVEAFVQALSTRVAQYTDLLVATTPEVRRQLERRRLTPHEEVLPLGVAPFWSQGIPPSRRTPRRNTSAYRVGVVGRLADEAGTPELLTTLRSFLTRVPGARAAIAGDGPARGDVRLLAEAPGMAGRVKFQVPRSRRNLRAIFHEIDALLVRARPGRTLSWAEPAQAAGVTLVPVKRSDEAVARLELLAEEGPSARAERRRQAMEAVVPAGDAARAWLRRYRRLRLHWRGATRGRVPASLLRHLTEASELVEAGWRAIDLRSHGLVHEAA